MGSEQSWNKNDNSSTSFQRFEPSLFSNGCGFFGTAATLGLCSKCHRDVLIEEEQENSTNATVEKTLQMFSNSPSSSLVVGTSIPDSLPSSAVESFTAKLAAVVVGEESALPIKPNRCRTCKRKVGLIDFKCKCGFTYCGTHRYPEKHECTFDFKSVGRDSIAKANPVIKANKRLDTI